MTRSAAGDVDRVRSALRTGGVQGAEDFGVFVNDRRRLQRPAFDEQAAMPILVELLPSLKDPKAVEAVARHLGRPWARPVALRPLAKAFRSWAVIEPSVGWTIGDSLATVPGPGDLDLLLDFAQDHSLGTARQMIVHSLWRFRKDPRVTVVLTDLARDPEVCLHAMSALRRAVGTDAALPLLLRLSRTSNDQQVRKQAAREVKKAERAVSRRPPAL